MNIQQIIQNFEHKNFDEASLDFFKYLDVPLNRLIEESIDVNDLLGVHEGFSIIDTTYMVGGIDNNIFQGHQSNSDLKIKRYEGLLVFAISLNISTPSRTQLSAISRIFNRKFEYTPVVILFKYANKLSLSNTQRQEYKQHWREGEKVGKVSILRDIDIEKPHRGHLDILQNMKITSKVISYETLYTHWQEVFDVSLLNEKFYKELSNWYSYAVSEVVFPNQPKDTDNVEEHKSQNVIRLLTRFLFVWFIKEKGLIPNEIFDEAYIKEKLKDFNPKNMDGTLMGGHDKSSLYYKAILQNLFFASLNCPIKPLDSNDTRERGFRKKEHYGQNRDANFLMRYEDSFHNPQEFLELINRYVPFLNGGLFECLDDKTNGVYIDGFSDNLVKPHQLIVPDYLFFGVEEHVDLSTWYGSKNKSFKDATVKGLIKILDTYKFTVAENTPLEEDVALDPELLGRVFENLLASYNPETKSTARKQTGSFYTPREIVSYMVDESLIAYLKTKLENENRLDGLEDNLRELCSYSDKQPFEDKQITAKLIHALDNLKALDPAVGSGAFPMGMLQKMVHILSKLDPDNKYWQELQLNKAKKESDDVFETKNKEEREKLLIEINNAFDETINNPDYARKLYIIENSIYGVDIQSIAIQISKLRFFISLVIEQKIDKNKDNFGVRPLPNLETKFIAANTLIGIEKDTSNLFNDEEIKKLEYELKKIRHRLFNAKTPQTKRKLRVKDKELREKIADKLEQNGLGNESAKLLAHWDPYEQNVSSPFFDMEWMFGIEDGFDIVIANPPYIDSENMVQCGQNDVRDFLRKHYNFTKGNWDIYVAFIEQGFKILKDKKGSLIFITPDKWITKPFGKELRKTTLPNIYSIFKAGRDVFDNVNVDSIVTLFKKDISKKIKVLEYDNKNIVNFAEVEKNIFKDPFQLDIIFSKNINFLINLESSFKSLSAFNLLCENACSTSDTYKLKEFILNPIQNEYDEELFYKIINTGTIDKYISRWGVKEMTYLKDKYLYPIVNKIEFEKNFSNSYGKKASMKKLIIKGLTLLDATIDTEGIYIPAKSTLIIPCDSKQKLNVIGALINSKIAKYYIVEKYSSSSYNGGVNFTKGMINNLPIPNIFTTTKMKTLSILVEVILMLKNIESTINPILFENIVDSIIFESYFEKHMKEKKINITEFIEQDIKEISPNYDFESLNDEEKEQLIQKLYDKWTHPDNEVRNRMKLFAVRSPDILKPILES